MANKAVANKGNGPLIDPALCRCCRSIKKCRVLTAEYVFEGEPEVYSDMFMDVFGLLLAHLDGDAKDSCICATCVKRLREAGAFRQQVLQSEQMFLKTMMEANEAGQQHIKIEIKEEPREDLDERNGDDLIEEHYDEPDSKMDTCTDDDNPSDSEPLVKKAKNSTKKRQKSHVLTSTNTLPETELRKPIKREIYVECEVERVKNDPPDSTPKSKRKRLENKNWQLHRTFESVQKAVEFIKSENTWSYQKTHEVREGIKKYFRCNQVKRKGPQCPAQLYYYVGAFSDVLMFRTDSEHEHEMKIKSSYGINERAKAEINRLYDLHFKPKGILDSLAEMEGMIVPKMSQLRTYLSSLRNRVKQEPAVNDLEGSDLQVSELDSREDSGYQFGEGSSSFSVDVTVMCDKR